MPEARPHYIEDDLGGDKPSWLDLADILMEYEIHERLTAERIMDDLTEEKC